MFMVFEIFEFKKKIVVGLLFVYKIIRLLQCI